MRHYLTALAALTLMSCGGPDEGEVTTADGKAEYTVDADGRDSEIRFTDTDGNETVINSGTAVEAELPDGFTVYPGARIVSNTTMSGAQGAGSLVSIASDDPLDEVVAFYRQQAEAAGVEIEMEMKNGEAVMIGGESPDGLFFSFNASPEGGGTSGVLMAGRQ